MKKKLYIAFVIALLVIIVYQSRKAYAGELVAVEVVGMETAIEGVLNKVLLDIIINALSEKLDIPLSGLTDNTGDLSGILSDLLTDSEKATAANTEIMYQLTALNAQLELLIGVIIAAVIIFVITSTINHRRI